MGPSVVEAPVHSPDVYPRVKAVWLPDLLPPALALQTHAEVPVAPGDAGHEVHLLSVEASVMTAAHEHEAVLPGHGVQPLSEEDEARGQREAVIHLVLADPCQLAAEGRESRLLHWLTVMMEL